MRADSYLTLNGFVESRTRAARFISEGKILIDGKKVNKPSEEITDCEHDVVITEADAYVGRGGLKLESALVSFDIDVSGKRCIDVGASTGGFTDCLLQNGAKEVYSVDSGRGQLHEKLLNDPRVVNIEGYNARELSPDDLGTFDVAVMDVSFISQTLIHPALATVLGDGAVFISLIKPQFEAGRSALGKNGIVKNKKDREAAIFKVVESAQICGFELMGLKRSPITGGDGNREYLALFVRRQYNSPINTAIDRKNIAVIAER
jgi:23S rRNA (cytidine1920-2'-O)/16S rRNA (cytidine1409-2'-O)-methyltransferase